jgi:hypothetical protein
VVLGDGAKLFNDVLAARGGRSGVPIDPAIPDPPSIKR